LLGPLLLAYMAYIQRDGRVPFRFMERISLTDYVFYGVVTFAAFLAIWRLIGAFCGEVPTYAWVTHSIYETSAVIAYNFLVAITEESFKVAFTNIVARVWHVSYHTMRMVVIGFGILGVGLWAYLHVAIGGHSLAYAGIVFVSGLVIFVIVYHKHNYIPTTVAHGVWNVWVDLLRFLS